jgi:hypothetical protein
MDSGMDYYQYEYKNIPYAVLLIDTPDICHAIFKGLRNIEKDVNSMSQEIEAELHFLHDTKNFIKKNQFLKNGIIKKYKGK